VGKKCEIKARNFLYATDCLSSAPEHATWDRLHAHYRRLVYADSLTMVHPSRYYYTIPVCEVCYKIYTYLDTERPKIVLHDPVHHIESHMLRQPHVRRAIASSTKSMFDSDYMGTTNTNITSARSRTHTGDDSDDEDGLGRQHPHGRGRLLSRTASGRVLVMPPLPEDFNDNGEELDEEEGHMDGFVDEEHEFIDGEYQEADPDEEEGDDEADAADGPNGGGFHPRQRSRQQHQHRGVVLGTSAPASAADRLRNKLDVDRYDINTDIHTGEYRVPGRAGNRSSMLPKRVVPSNEEDGNSKQQLGHNAAASALLNVVQRPMSAGPILLSQQQNPPSRGQTDRQQQQQQAANNRFVGNIYRAIEAGREPMHPQQEPQEPERVHKKKKNSKAAPVRPNSAQGPRHLAHSLGQTHTDTDYSVSVGIVKNQGFLSSWVKLIKPADQQEQQYQPPLVQEPPVVATTANNAKAKPAANRRNSELSSSGKHNNHKMLIRESILKRSYAVPDSDTEQSAGIEHPGVHETGIVVGVPQGEEEEELAIEFHMNGGNDNYVSGTQSTGRSRNPANSQQMFTFDSQHNSHYVEIPTTYDGIDLSAMFGDAPVYTLDRRQRNKHSPKNENYRPTDATHVQENVANAQEGKQKRAPTSLPRDIVDKYAYNSFPFTVAPYVQQQQRRQQVSAQPNQPQQANNKKDKDRYRVIIPTSLDGNSLEDAHGHQVMPIRSKSNSEKDLLQAFDDMKVADGADEILDSSRGLMSMPNRSESEKNLLQAFDDLRSSSAVHYESSTSRRSSNNNDMANIIGMSNEALHVISDIRHTIEMETEEVDEAINAYTHPRESSPILLPSNEREGSLYGQDDFEPPTPKGLVVPQPLPIEPQRG
jgi:hypothetical protein